MSTAPFDPYRKWLGIPPAEQPPHHYRLLGIGLYESDPEVIQEAADRQMAHVRTHQSGPHSQTSQQILNQISLARICLSNPLKKSAYDDQLKAQLAPQAPPPPPPPPGGRFPPVAPPYPPASAMGAPPSAFTPPPIARFGAPGVAPSMGQPQAMAMPIGQPMRPAAPFERTTGAVVVPKPPPSVAATFAPQIKTEESTGESVSDRYRRAERPAWFLPVVGGGAVMGLIVVVLVISSMARPSAPRKVVEGPDRPVRGSGTRLPPRIPSGIDQDAAVTTTRSGRPIRPAPPTVLDKLELLDLIDTNQHAMRGEWTFVGGNLLSPASGVSRLRIPFAPPEEYQLSLIVDRKEGDNSLNIVLVSGEVQFAVLLDARGGRVSGLHLVDDLTVMANPTTHDGSVFSNNEPAAVVITVRKSGVKVTSDDKVIVDFKGKLSRLSMDTSAGEKLDKTAMYIGALDSNYLISRMELTPLEPDLTPEPEPAPATPTETQPERKSLADLVERQNRPGASPVRRGPRQPIPDSSLLAAAHLRVKEELFKDKLAAARKPPEKVALSKQILKLAQETKDDLPLQYALFESAQNLAAEGGDFQAAWQTIDEQAGIFVIRPVLLKQRALAQVARMAKIPGDFKFIAELTIFLINEAVREDEYELSLELAEEAIVAARKGKDLALLAFIQDRIGPLQEVNKGFVIFKGARDRLAVEPTDVLASEAWGEFLCTYKQDWTGGLPLWAKGTDPACAVASRDLANPSNDAARLSLADEWWTMSQGKGGLPSISLILRAAHWYRLTRPSANDEIRARVEERLAQASEHELGLKRGEWVDLLRLVEIPKHRTQGNWLREGADVAVRNSQNDDRFMLPVAPRGSYDLHVRFSRSAGDDPFIAILPVAGGTCVVTLGANGGKLSRIEGAGVVTEAKPGQFMNDRLHQVEFRVDVSEETARVTVDFNGQPYLKWQGPRSAMTANSRYGLRKPGALGLATGGKNSLSIHGAKFRLHSGTVQSLLESGP